MTMGSRLKTDLLYVEGCSCNTLALFKQDFAVEIREKRKKDREGLERGTTTSVNLVGLLSSCWTVATVK